MKLAYWTFFLFVLLKPFYIFESGSLQIGDVFLIISLMIFIYTQRGVVKLKNKVDYLFVYFLIFSLIVNTFYFVYYTKVTFIISSLYYIFNFIVIYLFRYYAEDQSFLKKLLLVVKINVFLQLFIYLIGKGSFYDNLRYMGTFNDPNQFSFFIYISLMIIYLISYILKVKINPLYILAVFFLVIKSASTGMVIAMILFILLLLISKIYNFFQNNIKLKTLLIFNFTAIILVLLLTTNIEKFRIDVADDFLMKRIEEKIVKLGNDGNYVNRSYSDLNLIEERGIDKLLLYPEKTLLGAGQGYYERFNKAAHQGEIHSTLPSILFYYGVLPFLLLLIWFIKNIKKITLVSIIIFLPLLLESFTLLNQRQPFFWILFILMNVYMSNRKSDESLQ